MGNNFDYAVGVVLIVLMMAVAASGLKSALTGLNDETAAKIANRRR